MVTFIDKVLKFLGIKKLIAIYENMEITVVQKKLCKLLIKFLKINFELIN